MRKRWIFLAGFIVLAIVIILLVVLFTPGSDAGNLEDGNGLTAAQKKEAIYIALSTGLKDVILGNPGNCRVTEASALGAGGFTGKAGYINATGLYAQVPVSVGGEGMYSEHYLAYVNLTGKEVTGTEWASYRRLPASAEVSIPPGAGWYHEIKGCENISIWGNTHSTIDILVLDEENFKKALEGGTYQPEYVPLTGIVRPAGFSTTIQATAEKYLVIRNYGEGGEVDLNIRFMPG